MVGEEVSAVEYSPLSWQSPPPTSLALTLSLTRPVPSVVGKYFWVTLSCDLMIPLRWADVSVEVRTGRKTPLSIRVLSSASIAGRAVVGSSFIALFAVMCKVSLLGGLLSLEGYVRAGGSATATSGRLIVLVSVGSGVCAGGSSKVGGSVVGATTSSAGVVVGGKSMFSAVSRVETAGAMSRAVGSSEVRVGSSDSLIISMSIGRTVSSGSAAGAA